MLGYLFCITLADLSNYQPTQFQPVGLCKKSTGNQPRSYPHIGQPTVIPTMCFKIRRLEWRLVFAKPTVIPTIGYDIQRLDRGWFSQDQPSAFLYEGWKSVGFGLIFCTKQLSTVGPVREGTHLFCKINVLNCNYV